VVLLFVCGVQAEQELSEMSYQLDEMSTRLEEADGMTSAQVCTSVLDSLLNFIVVVIKF